MNIKPNDIIFIWSLMKFAKVIDTSKRGIIETVTININKNVTHIKRFSNQTVFNVRTISDSPESEVTKLTTMINIFGIVMAIFIYYLFF